jgi:stage V sporulation protein R
MAHVFGHVDFFQQNAWFRHTNRKMLDEMANHAARISRYIDRYGVAAVEGFLDACLSIDNLIDPMRPHIVRERDDEAVTDPAIDGPGKLPSKTYMDKYINPPDYLQRMREKAEAERLPDLHFPEHPLRDVLLFLLQHAPLASWQADVLAIVREEAYYFAPQGQTKIMNEGWASYWHSHLMTRPGNLNPYKLGLELFRHIEERWNKGQFGKDWLECDDERERNHWDTGAGLGREKIFEVRRTHNDVTFIDTFLTPEFVRQQGLFSYEYDKRSRQFVVDNREFEAVKQKLLFMLSNHGQPRIEVTNGNHANRGELELTHIHEGVDIQLDWARETMGNICRIWRRPVHLLTRIDDKPTVASHDGSEFKTALVGAAAKKDAKK